MSEQQTWNSEDTQPCSFKVFFALGMLIHWPTPLTYSTYDCCHAQRQNALSSLWKVCSSLMAYLPLQNPGLTTGATPLSLLVAEENGAYPEPMSLRKSAQ